MVATTNRSAAEGGGAPANVKASALHVHRSGVVKCQLNNRIVGSNPLAQGAGVIQDAGARGKVGEPVIIPLVKQVLIALDVEEAASLIVYGAALVEIPERTGGDVQITAQPMECAVVGKHPCQPLRLTQPTHVEHPVAGHRERAVNLAASPVEHAASQDCQIAVQSGSQGQKPAYRALAQQQH